MRIQAQAPDGAGAYLHGDADEPPATDREFPHPLRGFVEHDGIDRDQRRSRGREAALVLEADL
jgi:hypothetical protein